MKAEQFWRQLWVLHAKSTNPEMGGKTFSVIGKSCKLGLRGAGGDRGESSLAGRSARSSVTL